MAKREEQAPASPPIQPLEVSLIESPKTPELERRAITDTEEERRLVRNIRRLDAQLLEEDADVAELSYERAVHVERLEAIRKFWADLEALKSNLNSASSSL